MSHIWSCILLILHKEMACANSMYYEQVYYTERRLHHGRLLDWSISNPELWHAHAGPPGKYLNEFGLPQVLTHSGIPTVGGQTGLIWLTLHSVHHDRFLLACSSNQIWTTWLLHTCIWCRVISCEMEPLPLLLMPWQEWLICKYYYVDWVCSVP